MRGKAYSKFSSFHKNYFSVSSLVDWVLQSGSGTNSIYVNVDVINDEVLSLLKPP